MDQNRHPGRDHVAIFVSIIIPARNIESTIAEALDSILNQSCQNWEALVVVNDSHDGTLAIVQRFASTEPRIRLIECATPGVSEARNLAIDRAQYEWVLFLDGDDWIPPDHLHKMTTALHKNPQFSAVYCGWCWVSPDGYYFHQHVGKESGNLFHIHADECPNAIHAYLVQRQSVKSVGGFDPKLHTCEDWDIWQRISRSGVLFALVPEVLAPCRMRPLSASTDGHKILADGLQVLNKGHQSDDRVPTTDSIHPGGLSSHNLPEKKVYLLCSAAGLLIGRNDNALCLLPKLEPENYPELDYYAIADCIVLATLLSACRPLAQWDTTWTSFESDAGEFIIALEEHLEIEGLAKFVITTAPSIAQIHMGVIDRPNKIRAIGNKLKLFPYKIRSSLPRYIQIQKYHLKRWIVTTLRLLPRLNQSALKVYRHLYPAEDQEYFQELFDDQPDPWGYTSDYEQTKYQQTLDMLEDHPVQNAIELGCAEGHFSIQLAPKVGRLLCTDLSETALDRAAQRCNQLQNVSYQPLDITNDAIPGKFDLMVCSEMLYYAGTRKKLRTIAQKMADALNTDGLLVMAHGNLVVDEPDRTGFNWSHEFGAKGIGEVFSEISDLHFTRELHTPLYRVQCFKKIDTNRIQKNEIPPKVQIVEIDQPTKLEADVESQVLWNGTSDRLPILLYHSITPEPSTALADWTVSPQKFEEHLAALRESGCQSVTLDDCYNWIYESTPLPKNAVLITFDDGYQDFIEHAWPCLERNGFTATVFLVANEIGKSNAWDSQYGERKALMDWDQILDLRKAGITLGSHSSSHPQLTSVNRKTLNKELHESKEALEQVLDEPIKSLAYPYGESNFFTRFLAGLAGYDLAFTCDEKISRLHHSPLALPRIEVTESDSGASLIKKLEV